MKSSNIFLDEYDDTEEFIQNIMPIEDKYFVKLDCKVADFETKNGDIQIKQIIKLSTLRNAGKKFH